LDSSIAGVGVIGLVQQTPKACRPSLFTYRQVSKFPTTQLSQAFKSGNLK
jgi:hypothetical protein